MSHPAIEELSGSLDSELEKKFGKVLQLLGAGLPIDSLIVDLGDNPHLVKGNELADDVLALLVATVSDQLRNAGLSWDDVEQSLKSYSIIGANWDRAESMVRAYQISGNLD